MLNFEQIEACLEQEVKIDLRSNCKAQARCVDLSKKSVPCNTPKNIIRSTTSNSNFNQGVVKSYVASLTDKFSQKHLKDRDRNKCITAVRLHHSDDGDHLLCETDDIVLEYRCSYSVHPYCHYWYVKQDESRMLQEEKDKLANLRKGQIIGRGRYAEIWACAARHLDELHGLILFYM